MDQVTIIDYGCGNIRSVFNAIRYCLFHKKRRLVVKVSKSLNDIEKSSHIILPGVGSFKSCLEGFHRTNGLYECLYKNVIIKKKPFLGICVGMQMLVSKGFEDGENDGFNWVSGKVKKIKPLNRSLKIPHIGWNTLTLKKKNRFIDLLHADNSVVDKNREINAYFVHSYSCVLENSNLEIFSTNYDQEITAMIAKKNILGTQFHPEKSQNFGLKFLDTFLSWDGTE